MRWHDILRVLDELSCCAVRVKQHDGEVRVRYDPNGALWSDCPERNASYAPSLPMDQGQQFAETIGYESSRTEDTCRIGIGPRSISIILLLVLLFYSGARCGYRVAGITRGFR